MNNSRAWGYNSKAIEGFSTPLEELEALGVARKLQVEIFFEGIRLAVDIDLKSDRRAFQPYLPGQSGQSQGRQGREG